MFRRFQSKLSLRLLLWSVFSIISGMLMLKRGQFWKGVGIQFISWGAIDAMIAIGGQVASDKRLNHTASDDMPVQIEKDTRNLKIALWANAGLDVLYMLGGFVWMRRKLQDDHQQGNGLGIIIQGMFLFFFDIYHALKLQEISESSDD